MVSLQNITVSGFFLFLSYFASGIVPVRPSAGAGEAGMAFAGIMKPGIWSSFQNQALLPLLGKSMFSFSIENRFGLSELSTRSVCLAIPSGHSAAGIYYSCFGFSDFKRETIGLASGVKLSPNLSAGIETDLFTTRSAGNFKDYYQISFQGGILFSFNENIQAGICIFNPVPNSIRKIPVPSSISAGAGMLLHSNLYICILAEMTAGSNICFRSGFEYTAGKKFKLRGGYSTAKHTFSFGAGWITGRALIDLAFTTHPQLGITSALSVTLPLQNKKIFNE